MNNPHLLLVLQTHSKGNSAGDRERFCKAPKKEVMRRCTKSLIDSINYAVDLLPNFTFELKIFDDHSDDDAIEDLKNNLNTAKFKTDLEFLSTYGIMPSILACYEYGKKHGKDWVYFIQDDYLYEKTAIYDMLAVIIQTTQNIGNFTCVFPYNDPYRYDPVNTVIQSHIIQMQGRHWRTQIMTGSCFMVHYSILVKEWDLFEAMGKHEVTTDMEDKTINQLFRTRGYYLFVPIPSLALHMQYEREEDPFINWKEWWNRYEPIDHKKIDDSKKNLLNIGYDGKSYKDSEYSDDLIGYYEITMGVDNEHNPDIIGDMIDLTSIPSHSFDCIYSYHTLEKIDYYSVPVLLKEFKRLLKPKGFARIIVTNIQIVGMYLLQDKLLQPIKISDDLYTTPIDLLYLKDKKISGFTKNIINKINEKINLDLEIEEINTDLIITLKNE